MLEATKDNYGIIEDLYMNPGKLVIPQPHGDKVKYHHLYIVDLEAEIKIGDHCIMEDVLMNPVIVQTEADRCNNHPTISPYCFKVICSTDKLIDGWDYKNDIPGGDHYNKFLPQLSEQSIKLLIDYYNKYKKMPDEVEIIIHKEEYPGKDDPCDYCIEVDTMLNPQGTVDVTIPEDSIINLLKKAFIAGVEFTSEGSNGEHPGIHDSYMIDCINSEFNEWIKQNL